MEIRLSSFFLEPGINFKQVSYKVNLLIAEQLNQQLFQKISLPGGKKDYTLDLNITTNQKYFTVTLDGPYISEKQKMLEWNLFLPYENIAFAADSRTAYVECFFDAIVELLARYDVEESAIRIIQAAVKTEVAGNPAYDLEEEELFDYEPDIENLVRELGIGEEASQVSYPILYSSFPEGIHYWEIWHDNENLMTHWGTVGEKGKFHQILLSMVADSEKEMAEQFAEKIREGFREAEQAEEIELVVQYRYVDAEMMQALEKRHNLETFLDEWLGQTGNGYCREGDIGNGTINVYCHVIDRTKALECILSGLAAEGLKEDVTIAYLDEEIYYSLNPEKGIFLL